ncbi:MAG: protein adenylyltransferase SelO family protein, partial [Pseudomonadota bacterium]|nr:protein adenylyltransferase SelO family protein [Pseudomonadota bacterium]
MKSSLKFKDLGGDFFAHVKTQKLENTTLIHINENLKQELNLKVTDKDLLRICSGEKQLAKESPISSVYA